MAVFAALIDLLVIRKYTVDARSAPHIDEAVKRLKRCDDTGLNVIGEIKVDTEHPILIREAAAYLRHAAIYDKARAVLINQAEDLESVAESAENVIESFDHLTRRR